MNLLSVGLASVLLALSVTACDGGGEASCAVCQVSLTDQECAQIAQSNGCTSGLAATDPHLCGGQVAGCKLEGCPDAPITCSVAGSDAGSD